jgi:hypothetical protein
MNKHLFQRPYCCLQDIIIIKKMTKMAKAYMGFKVIIKILITNVNYVLDNWLGLDDKENEYLYFKDIDKK